MIIETQIDLVDRKHEELTGNELLTPVNMFFKLENVIAVRETIDDGKDEVNPGRCVVYLTSGELFITYFPYKKMLELLKCKK